MNTQYINRAAINVVYVSSHVYQNETLISIGELRSSRISSVFVIKVLQLTKASRCSQVSIKIGVSSVRQQRGLVVID